MKKILLFAILFLGIAVGVQGQTKLDIKLYSMSKQSTSTAKDNNGAVTNNYVTVMGIQEDGAELPQAELDSLGVIVDHCAYGIAHLRVPQSSLAGLDRLKSFRSFEAQKKKKLMNKISHQLEHVDALQDKSTALAEGLPQTYTGEGVIVGVFDSGIDYNHVNFRDTETNKTRIKKAVLFRNFQDLQDSVTTYTEYKDIMEVYTNESDIDTLTTDCISESHGTHTSSTAGGSYNGAMLNKDGNVAYSGYRGTAYKADLTLGSSEYLYNDLVTLAIEQFGLFADKVKKPIVINLSMGNNGNWLDGKNASPIFYDRFTNHGNKPGRIICVSAGNEAMEKFTIYKQLDETNDYMVKTILACDTDTINNVYKYNNAISYFCSDSTRLQATVDIINLQTGAVVKTLTESELLNTKMLTQMLAFNHDERFEGQITIPFQNVPMDQGVAVTIKSPRRKPCKVRIFHQSLEDEECLDLRGGLEGYTAGDSDSSINPDAATDGVLCVGAWSGNDQWHPYLRPDTIVSSRFSSPVFCTGNIAQFSSYCIEDDRGKMLPDFTAPGMGIISGYNVRDTTNFDKVTHYPLPAEKNKYWKTVVGESQEEYGRQDGLKSMFGEMQGTSMSCPNAVGVIALWLQANPELTVNQIRDVIKHTADHDEFTDGEYQVRFGAGKINALEGLKYILQYYPTAIHEVINGNPKGLEGPTIKKMLKNGQLIIVKDGKEYNSIGQLI